MHVSTLAYGIFFKSVWVTTIHTWRVVSSIGHISFTSILSLGYVVVIGHYMFVERASHLLAYISTTTFDPSYNYVFSTFLFLWCLRGPLVCHLSIFILAIQNGYVLWVFSLQKFFHYYFSLISWYIQSLTSPSIGKKICRTISLRPLTDCHRALSILSRIVGLRWHRSRLEHDLL